MDKFIIAIVLFSAMKMNLTHVVKQDKQFYVWNFDTLPELQAGKTLFQSYFSERLCSVIVGSYASLVLERAMLAVA